MRKSLNWARTFRGCAAAALVLAWGGQADAIHISATPPGEESSPSHHRHRHSSRSRARHERAVRHDPEEAARLKEKGDELQQQGKLDEASKVYAEAYARDPSNIPLIEQYGRTLYGLARYQDAADLFRKAASPDQPAAYWNLGYALRKLHDYKGAAEAYLNYENNNRDDPDGLYEVAECYRKLGQTQDAIEAYNLYVQKETRPDQQSWVDKAKGKVQMLMQAQASAAQPTVVAAASSSGMVVSIPTAAPAVTSSPPAVTAPVAVAAPAVTTTVAPDASPTVVAAPQPVAEPVAAPTVVATSPPAVVATPPPAVVATPPPAVVATPPPAVVATPPVAEPVAAPTVVATPAVQTTPTVVATPPPAVTTPDAVAAPAPTDAEPTVVATPPPAPVRDPQGAIARVQDGDRLFKQKQFEDALAAYQDAIRLDDQFANGYLRMGLALANLGRFQEAIDQWQHVLQLEPDNREAPRYIAKAQEHLSSAAPAAVVSATPQPLQVTTPDAVAVAPAAPAPAVNPGHPPTEDETNGYRQGIQDLRSGSYQQALTDLTTVLNENPGFVNAYVARGRAYAGTRDYADAVADYMKALSLNPNMATPLFGLAQAYQKQGSNADACDNYRKYLQSSAPDVQDKLKEIAQREMSAVGCSQ